MSHFFDCIAQNPLDTVTVSYPRRLNYTDVHIAALQNNNTGGIYDTLIAETRKKRDALYDVIYSSVLNEGYRKSGTAEIKEITAEFRLTISKFEGLVKSIFGKKTQIYITFFPSGIENYRRASQSEMQTQLNNLIVLNLTYKTELGTMAFHDLFADISIRFKNAIAKQQHAAGILAFNVTDKVILWNDLKKQIHKNMLTIALHNIDTPNMLKAYEESHLLRFHRRKKGVGEKNELS